MGAVVGAERLTSRVVALRRRLAPRPLLHAEFTTTLRLRPAGDVSVMLVVRPTPFRREVPQTVLSLFRPLFPEPARHARRRPAERRQVRLAARPRPVTVCVLTLRVVALLLPRLPAVIRQPCARQVVAIVRPRKETAERTASDLGEAATMPPFSVPPSIFWCAGVAGPAVGVSARRPNDAGLLLA